MKPVELPTTNGSHQPQGKVPLFVSLRKIPLAGIATHFRAKESRSAAVSFVIAFCLLVLIIPNVIMERSSRKEVSSLQARQKEFSVIAGQYASVKGRLDVIERRSVSNKVRGAAETLEEIFSSIGVASKLKSIKSAGSRGFVGDLREENAQVQIEKLTLNELVNIFFRIENAPIRLVVRSAAMKKSFEKPELLDVTMSISLFTPVLQQR